MRSGGPFETAVRRAGVASAKITAMPFFRAASLLALLSLPWLASPGCAQAECKYNSDCAAGLCINGTCERECFAPIDCPKDRPACVRGTCAVATDDAGVPITDAGKDTSSPLDSGKPDTTTDDTSVPPTDSEPPVDTSVPPSDTAVSKGYLTACTSDGECASGKCTTVAPQFCTKSCSAHTDCAHGQICGGGVCRLDDTGKACTTAANCLQYCGGIVGASHCTHSCSTGADCPAGYACSSAGGTKICVSIERSCTAPTQCPSGLGFCGSGMVGCTAECTTAADCPTHWVGLPGYTCEARSGKNVCVPPSVVIGGDPFGTTCSFTSGGSNYCRSEVCDDVAPAGKCIQRCTLRGGCPSGWGCFPLEDTSGTALICNAAGSGWLGNTCSRGSDCATGMCWAPGYCTRMCADGYCPDGMTCTTTPVTATDGTVVKICQK